MLISPLLPSMNRHLFNEVLKQISSKIDQFRAFLPHQAHCKVNGYSSLSFSLCTEESHWARRWSRRVCSFFLSSLTSEGIEFDLIENDFSRLLSLFERSKTTSNRNPRLRRILWWSWRKKFCETRDHNHIRRCQSQEVRLSFSSYKCVQELSEESSAVRERFIEMGKNLMRPVSVVSKIGEGFLRLPVSSSIFV